MPTPEQTRARETLRPVSRFKFLSVSDLLSLPPPRWRVHELIEETGIGVLYAPSGAGKTFASLDLACSIVRGLPWFGLDVEPGPVCYVAAEGMLSERVRAYIAHHQIESDELDGLRVLPSSVNLLAPFGADADELVTALQAERLRMGGLALVVIDTLNRVMPGGNENASEDMGGVIASAGRIKDACGCFVLFIHHSGKDESKGGRGHSSLKAAAECEIQIEHEAGGTRVIQATKVRDAECRRVGAFTLHPIELGERVSCVVEPCDVPKESRQKTHLTAAERIALDCLHEIVDDPALRKVANVKAIEHGARQAQYVAVFADFRQRFYSRRGNDPASRQAFSRLRDSLQAKGKIQSWDDFIWLAD